ncbi:ribonuclease Y [Candidatus Shapirobacteria bacterium CG08_land_8_20_14_0_20_39_18]|uniref:Ribonuclease Y n=1 Tax=Candidatus Shapirobacteria bacterium CG08_land_8_20_14_0_20_39_18 TaxID=1974883 RepID=A0A2M6XE71_9BACT|nr:MAG: ribonuclease Y [Candidatus Shapirobacteria bacterium CG08_land_8_20_14_0_20_39_18]PIY64627.1 MAG: ribonuclease Y [Candidatus Shapirobacteria bacterium CG_4_10_14_0_8_um_filter_39_15]PJE68416.1 MAG: ribonuclease Y [Candidatus Shapirobacteria bacterium CG10_big_fil_rev_8_21_14_0_10_38_8]
MSAFINKFGLKSNTADLEKLAQELDKFQADLEKKEGALEVKEKLLVDKEIGIEKEQGQLRTKKEELLEKLQTVNSLSKEQAKKELFDELEKYYANEVAKRIQEAELEVKSTADEKAKEILVDAMRHGATDWVAEYSVSTIRLPDEEIKGRIIGREGRNIKAFEQLTGVEIELDETLDLRISSFDSVRREIARLTLEKLIRDGRIQPDRIEELVAQTKTEIDNILFEEGKKLSYAVGVYNLHPDLIKMLGRYKYRFSYGQNLAIHTLEETKIGMAIANELKADVGVIRLGCLLHDIGKVVTEEEGTHVELGVELLKKYQIPEKVIAVIAEHHEDKPFSCLESVIVWIADAVSAGRPGARYTPHEEYAKRMTHIEDVAKSFPEVEEAAAYQAGREVRVIVKPDQVSDSELIVLTKKIAEKLEEDARWAGQIKVVAIREVRATEIAK